VPGEDLPGLEVEQPPGALEGLREVGGVHGVRTLWESPRRYQRIPGEQRTAVLVPQGEAPRAMAGRGYHAPIRIEQPLVIAERNHVGIAPAARQQRVFRPGDGATRAGPIGRRRLRALQERDLAMVGHERDAPIYEVSRAPDVVSMAMRDHHTRKTVNVDATLAKPPAQPGPHPRQPRIDQHRPPRRGNDVKADVRKEEGDMPYGHRGQSGQSMLRS